MYWHVIKGFRAALKEKHMNVIKYCIEELELSLDHEAFKGLMHLFVYGCSLATDEAAQQLNREILTLLVKGKGKNAIDELDAANGSTPLMIACENVDDIEIIKILVEGGSDINAVNNDEKMPLSLIKERLEGEGENSENENLGKI